MCVYTHACMYEYTYIHAYIRMHTGSIGIMHRAMRWLWLVGSIKVQVSFAKEPYIRDNILPKRPIIYRPYY